jgi:hypothetical protein
MVGPLRDVLQKTGIVIIDEQGGIRMQRGDQDNAVTNSTFVYSRFDIWREVQALPLLLRLNGHVIAMNAHVPLRWAAEILADVPEEGNSRTINLYGNWGTVSRQNDRG